MWIIAWMPAWAFYFVLGIASIVLIATYFLRFIPLPVIWTYKIPIQIAAIALIIFSVYMIGAKANDEYWQQKVAAVELKLAEAEALSQKETIKIVEKIVYKDRIVRERGQNIIQYIDREIVKYDTRCEIPTEFIDAHNQAVEKPK